MFVYNVKLSANKFIIAVLVIVAIFITGIAIFKTFNESRPSSTLSNVYEIDPANYTNILKAVHDNLDTYIGQKIRFSGYVYRVYDLPDTEFILARDMVINSDNDTLIVGFLCNYENAKDFEDGTWVNIVGESKSGYYHGEVPIVDLIQIEKIEKPSDGNVYPPDDFYIPTSSLIYDKSY